MGSGIAHVVALAGYNVLLNDVAPERIEKGIATDQRQHGPPGRSRQARPSEARKAALARISAGARHRATSAGADLVIEAATEDETVKRKIYAQLCPQLKPGRDPRHQHLVDLDHPARRRRPTGRSASSACIS